MTTLKTKRLLLPEHLRCTMQDQKGVRCLRPKEVLVTRTDGSSFELCLHCSKKLRDQINAHPERFNKVRFSIIH